MTTTGSCPSTAAPSAGHPPVCLADAAGGSQEMVRPRLVLFGDSITEQSFRPGGWGAALADTYSRKADVVVRGYGGYNTRWALFLIQQIFPLVGSAPPLATTIFFGANDAALLGRTSERQHVPVEEYKENLKKIVNHLKDCSKSMVIVLITPPPVDEDGRERYARSLYGEDARRLPERTNEMACVYASQCIELAREMDIHCVDIWSKMQATEGWKKLYLSLRLGVGESHALLHAKTGGLPLPCRATPASLMSGRLVISVLCWGGSSAMGGAGGIGRWRRRHGKRSKRNQGKGAKAGCARSGTRSVLESVSSQRGWRGVARWRPLFVCSCVLCATKKEEDNKGEMVFSQLLHGLTGQQRLHKMVGFEVCSGIERRCHFAMADQRLRNFAVT